MRESILPYGLPRACHWCMNIIKSDDDAKNICVHHKPFSARQKYLQYGWDYQIICKECWDWSCKHESLEKNQLYLIGVWADSV